MDTATAQCPAAPKPQSPPPRPMPRPGPDHPAPRAMTVAELEAAVAALPGKRDALREAFDRLAACSPSPLPFAWEDLDAHLVWLLSSISLRFRQVRALESARPAPAVAAPGETRGDGTGEQLEGDEQVVEEEVVVMEQEEEEKSDEEMEDGYNSEAGDRIGKDAPNEKGGRDEVLEEEEVEKATDDKIGNAIKEEKDAREEEQDADEKMHLSNVEEQSTQDGKKVSHDKEGDSNMEMEKEQSTNDAKKASQDKEEQNIEDAKKASREKEEDANMEEQATNMEEAANKKASALQGKEQEAYSEKQVQEEQEAHDEEQDAKNTTKEEEKATNVSRDQANQAHPGPCVFNDLAAAFSSMDARRLVKLIHTIPGLTSEFHAAMHHAPDAATLSLHVVELFLHDKMLKSNKVWGNCVGLIRTVPEVTKISTESIERAKLLAKDWQEMIDSPETCTALGSHASWGLLNFLIAYNIVSEFDTEEIFRIFGTMPRKYQKKNHSMLFKLGLTDRIPELMDYLIGNGQQMNVLYLAPIFNLVDKYPPFSILKGYVENAKQTVMEISQKNMTRQSLRAVIMKELGNLRIARDLANQKITDSGLHTCIMAEIYVLLGEFEKMKQSLADASTALTSNPQRQQTGSNKKHKKEQEHDKAQENQQQGKRSKLGKKPEKKQNKPQQEQQQKQKDKPQEKQQQKKHRRSKQPRKRTPKQPAQSSPVARNMPPRGHFVHPLYTSMHGVHHGYPAQPGWPGVHCAPPFVPQPRALDNIRPFNPFYPRPELYPQ